MLKWRQWCWTNYLIEFNLFFFTLQKKRQVTLLFSGDLRLPFWVWVKGQICLQRKQTQNGTQAVQLYRKEEIACSPKWSGRYESYMFTVGEQNSSATGLELYKVTGKGRIIWIRICYIKTVLNTRHPDVRSSMASFCLFFTPLSF